MMTEERQTDHGVDVYCLICGQRLLGERLDHSTVHADGRGWWTLCPECRDRVNLRFQRYQVELHARILRSFGYDVDLAIDGEAL